MKNIINYSLTICAILLVINAVAQATYEGNDLSAPPGSYLGWNNTVPDPLEIRHDASRPILFSTNGNENMEIASYRNVGVGTAGSSIRPKFYALLTQANASLGQGPFTSVAIMGQNNFRMIAQFADNIGVYGSSVGMSPITGLNDNNIGGRFLARNAWRNMAVDAFVGATNPGSQNVGDLGWAMRIVARDHSSSNIGIVTRATYGPTILPNTELVGISAGIDGAIGSTTEWAAAFQGNVEVWGDVTADNYWSPSDEQFKTNILPVDNALEIVNQLTPRKYEFLTDIYSHLNFREGEHYGLIAQELMEVVPELVVPSRMLTAYDTLGNVTAEPIEFLAVNYDGLIPILIAGMKEQQSIIEAQNEALGNVMDQLDDLQQQINNCCSDGEGYKNHNPGSGEEQQIQKSASPNGNILNQNTPNPFRSQTTISYSLETGGKVLLNVYDKNGKVLNTLEESEQQAGIYRYEWDASGLPAGLYHYALYVDGELLVKKAIKLKE